MPHLSRYVSASQEVLFVFSLAWGLGLSSLFYLIGFLLEVGALLAGVTLAVSPYAYEMGSRMKPIRDFFIMLFFVLLGAQMVLSQISSLLLPALLLSLFVLIGNPLIVFILMNLLGYRPRTAFMAGLTVAQISEFSLILVALGLSLGHIDQQIVSLVTLVGVITITGSTYLIIYADFIFNAIKGNLLKLFTWRKHYLKTASGQPKFAEVFIFGYDRVGHDFVEAAKQLQAEFMVVDFDPQAIRRLQDAGVPFCYGDAEDSDFLLELGLARARLVISSIPDFKANKALVKFFRQFNQEGIIIVLSHDIAQAKELYQAGASYVVMPHYLGARHAAELIIKHGFDKNNFSQVRDGHLNQILSREKNIIQIY